MSASGSRFSGMSKAALAEVDEIDRPVVQEIAETYDMMHHLCARTPHAQKIPESYLERYAIAGPAEEVRERLADYLRLPIDRLMIMGGSRDTAPELIAESVRGISTEVIPKLRSA